MHTISGMTLTTFDALRRVDGLGTCSPRDLRRIESLVDQLTVAPGVMLLIEGTMTRQAFVVVEGQLEVSVGGSSIGELGPGELAGEQSVLDGQPCSASVRAAETTRVLVFGPSALAAFMDEPALSRAIARAFDRRLCEETASPS